MARSQAEIYAEVRKKLLNTDKGAENFGNFMQIIWLIIFIGIAWNTSGAWVIAAWAAVFFQVLGIMMRAAGWRSITLRHEEQEYLRKHLK